MAFRTPTYWKSMLSRLRGSSTFATSTSPKMKATYPPTADFGRLQDRAKQMPMEGEFVPVYVAIGMIALSMSLGLYTAEHQLRYAPNVSVRKSRRETLPELVEPEHVVDDTEKFIKKSFFRKVAHIQEHDDIPADPFHGDVLAIEPRAETLKSVGVDPKLQ